MVKIKFADLNWPFLRGYFGSLDKLQWPLSLWRGGHCREVEIRVNVWTVCWDQTSGGCTEVTITGGSTELQIV